MEVEKTLRPSAHGTRKYVERSSDRLVCVRHRRNPALGRRFTTVEVVVDERLYPATSVLSAFSAPTSILVRIGYEESELRRLVKEGGGRRLPEAKLWEVPTQTVGLLGLQERVKSHG